MVSEGISGDEVLEWLKKNGRRCVDAVGSGPALLDLDWFTESMAAGRPVEVEPRHRLRVSKDLPGPWGDHPGLCVTIKLAYCAKSLVQLSLGVFSALTGGCAPGAWVKVFHDTFHLRPF